MSKETYTNSFYEELDATVIAKYQDTPVLDATSATINNGDLIDELSSDESLEMTLSDTQEVSAWLEESLLLKPGEVRFCAVETEDNVIALKEEPALKAELPGFFSDFENDAPEPPPSLRNAVTREPHLPVKAREKSAESAVQKWTAEIMRSGKRQLIGPSLVVVLALCGTVAYNVIQQKKDLTGSEPQTLSLVPQASISGEQDGVANLALEERYCLAQGIRLGAAIERSALASDTTAGLQILLADFAQRCENYQFVPEVYLSAHLVVGAEQTELAPQNPILLAPIELANDSVITSTVLQLDGSTDERKELEPVDTVVQNALVTQADSTRPSQGLKNIQWRLLKLGFFKARIDGKGRIDGIYNVSTQAAVNAFYKQHNEFTESDVEAEIFRDVDSVYAVSK